MKSRSSTLTAASSSASSEESSSENNDSSPLLFSAGLVADIQYAPIPDGHSFSGSPRYYRHALQAARHAAQHFEREKVELVLNLGDLVDGKCQDVEEHGGVALPDEDPGHYAADQVLDALSEYQHGPVLHVYGNHCLYNLNRHELQSKLGIPFQKEPCGDLVGYSAHTVESIRFIVLDSYDVAKMQRCEQSSQKYQAAHAILEKNNPNHATNENSPEGLDGLERRFVAFNGAVVFESGLVRWFSLLALVGWCILMFVMRSHRSLESK